MSTIHLALPDELKAYVDKRVDDGGYGSTSEYVRDLIRCDHDRQRLRGLLLDGAASTHGLAADDEYFEALLTRIQFQS